MQYFKTAFLRRKAERKRSCCVCQRSYYQKKRADKPCASWLRVIGLRLCVWLFDNCHIELCDMN